MAVLDIAMQETKASDMNEHFDRFMRDCLLVELCGAHFGHETQGS